MRVFTEEIDSLTRHFECVSVLLESSVNLDGRYDRRRFITNVTDMDNTYNRNNPVYSSKDDLFIYNVLNYDLLNVTDFETVFI
jgi:hypothetical protein